MPFPDLLGTLTNPSLLGVCGFWTKRLGLYLSIASGSKLGFEGVLMH